MRSLASALRPGLSALLAASGLTAWAGEPAVAPLARAVRELSAVNQPVADGRDCGSLTLVSQPYDERDRYALTQAEALVERVHRRRDRNSWSPAYDFWSGTQVQMAFSHEHIDSIVSKGFLNRFQSGRSSTAASTSTHARVEDDIVEEHIPDGEPGNTIRPKYAYLGFTRKEPGLSGSYYLTGYGDVVAVFDSPAVKKRTTYTAGDSFGSSRSTNPARTLQDKPREIRNAGNSYWEAQVWGPLKVSDVSYFLIDCFQSTVAGVAPVPAPAIAKLVRTGVPVFGCHPTSSRDAEGIGLQKAFRYDGSGNRPR